ncbi:hypothetical protein OQA88_12728 [Cercophora sp. LCS_1]
MVEFRAKCTGLETLPEIELTKPKNGLCAALLRINKQVYHETSPLLPAENRFYFPQYNFTAPNSYYESFLPLYQTRPLLIPFLTQLGDRTNLLQHISIRFPWRGTKKVLTRPSLFFEDLEEMYPPIPEDERVVMEVLRIDECSKSLPSLKQITLDLIEEHSHDPGVLSLPEWDVIRELDGKMHSHEAKQIALFSLTLTNFRQILIRPAFRYRSHAEMSDTAEDESVAGDESVVD